MIVWRKIAQTGSHQKLKNCDGVLRCSSPQVMASGRGAGEEEFMFLCEAGHWEFDRALVNV